MKRNTKLTWSPALPSAVAGKNVVIVVGTGGLGRALSRQLAGLGACVTVASQTFRNADMPGISFIQADLSCRRHH